MYIETILFVIVLTLLLSLIKNKSNFSSFIMIPLIVSLVTKYVLGDWDKGYAFTMMDIPYWLCLFGFSYATLYLFSQVKHPIIQIGAWS